jgi:hypothetical protein
MPQSLKMRFSPELSPGVFLLGRQAHPAKLFLHVETRLALVLPPHSLASQDCGFPHENPGVLVDAKHLQPAEALVQVAFPLANFPPQLLLSHDWGFPHEKPGVLALGMHVQVAKLPLHVALLLSTVPAQPLASQE